MSVKQSGKKYYSIVEGIKTEITRAEFFKLASEGVEII